MEARFLSPLRIEETPAGKLLIAPLEFYSAELRGIVVVPVNFVTDYASVPKWAQGVFSKDGPWRWGAVLHDAAYTAELRTQQGQRIALIKRLADRLFLEGMVCSNVPKVTRWIMFHGVQRFGGRVYGGLSQPVPPPAYARIITESLHDGTAWA